MLHWLITDVIDNFPEKLRKKNLSGRCELDEPNVILPFRLSLHISYLPIGNLNLRSVKV